MPSPAHKPAPNQYTLDFESARNRRYALVMGAIEAAGLVRQKELARLVFNLSERQEGAAVGYSMAEYAAAIGESKNTARRWLVKLAEASIVAVEQRPRHRGGCRTHLVRIDWESVRQLAFAGSGEERGARSEAQTTHPLAPHSSLLAPHLDRAPIFVDRAPNLGGRAPKLGAPYRKPISFSPESNTTTTYALPHARPLPHAATLSRNEEEAFVKKIATACRERSRHCPRLLESAIRRARTNGCTEGELWNRCRWFLQQQNQWPAEHRPGVLYTGLAEAMPAMRADEGWPYQR